MMFDDKPAYLRGSAENAPKRWEDEVRGRSNSAAQCCDDCGVR